MRKKIYDFVVHGGLHILSVLFPDIHMRTPLKPSDRFLEYPFAMARLPKQRASVLDVGCAGSFFPLMLAASGYDVTACDMRPYEILNNLSFEGLRFIQEDICNTSLPAETFDAVTCISTIEHVGIGGRYGMFRDENGDLRMAQKMLSLLKPGGTALITVPYGVAQIVAPYHRIYDYTRIKRLETGFGVVEERFYALDGKGDWAECSADAGEKIRGSIEGAALALLHLRKESVSTDQPAK